MAGSSRVVKDPFNRAQSIRCNECRPSAQEHLVAFATGGKAYAGKTIHAGSVDIMKRIPDDPYLVWSFYSSRPGDCVAIHYRVNHRCPVVEVITEDRLADVEKINESMGTQLREASKNGVARGYSVPHLNRA